MTTPRDDIAGLSERLRDALVDEPNYGKCLRMSLSYEDVEGAATQLDSLLKERDALQARVKELEAWQGIAQSTCEKFEGYVVKLKDAEARALCAEQERDSLKVDCSAYASRNTNLLNDLVLAGMARDAAEQERDEAYERAAKMAEILEWQPSPSTSKQNAELIVRITKDWGAKIAAEIRRLASGPEKEKKE